MRSRVALYGRVTGSGKVIEAAGGDVDGKTIAVLGIAFKPNTDDVREAASLTLIPALQKAGASIKAHDPQAMPAATQILENVRWGDDAYETADGADIAVILTEWNEYRALDLSRISEAMHGDLLVDFRNIYPLHEMENVALKYISVGRPMIAGHRTV